MKRSFTRWMVILIVFGLLLNGCATVSNTQEKETPAYTSQDLNEQLVMATLWMQTSAEYRALCYQTFNMAKMNLDTFLAGYTGSKPVAVIVDADETVVDNSAYEAFLIGNDFGYSSKTWTPWMAAAEAKAVPGALEFLKYAEEKGVEIFYVTNRKIVGYEGTEANLKKLGFPYVDQKHLMLRTKESDKQPRRDKVASEYEVAFLMGDNLNDFLSIFSGKSVVERFAEVEKLNDQWGKKFIVLPNPAYGDWEGAIYDYNWRATPSEKNEMRKERLEKWDYPSK